MKNNYFVTCPKGLELLLVDELKALGAKDVREKLAGVILSGDLEIAYKACLWSRLANRVLLELTKFSADTPEKLYTGVQKIAWDKHLRLQDTFAVQCVAVESEINHTLFAAQKVKDAIVDQFRKKQGERPNVERERPNVAVYVYILRDIATVYIDLSGESLHRRGFRLDTGAAPLKENLAAAILIRAKWPQIFAKGGSLMDPMCGSGTLLIEGAMMAYRIAPGLSRDYFGFLRWRQHDKNLWERLVKQAHEIKDEYARQEISITGYDADPNAIKVAFANIERAGLLGKVHVEKRDLAEFLPKQNAPSGLVVVNPPYGERLGEENELVLLYRLLGERLKAHFEGWKAAVFTGNPELGLKMRLHSIKRYALYNGTIPCKLLLFDLEKEHFISR